VEHYDFKQPRFIAKQRAKAHDETETSYSHTHSYKHVQGHAVSGAGVRPLLAGQQAQRQHRVRGDGDVVRAGLEGGRELELNVRLQHALVAMHNNTRTSVSIDVTP